MHHGVRTELNKAWRDVIHKLCDEVAFWNRFADDMDAVLNQGAEPTGEFTQAFQVYTLLADNKALQSYKDEVGEAADLMFQFSMMRLKEDANG